MTTANGDIASSTINSHRVKVCRLQTESRPYSVGIDGVLVCNVHTVDGVMHEIAEHIRMASVCCDAVADIPQEFRDAVAAL